MAHSEEKPKKTVSTSFSSLSEDMPEILVGELREDEIFKEVSSPRRSSTSFADLAGEDAPKSKKSKRSKGTHEERRPYDGTHWPPEADGERDLKDRINARVLGASAKRGTPAWALALYLCATALAMQFFDRQFPHPMLSLAVVAMSLLASLMSVWGIRRAITGIARAACSVALLLSLWSALVGYQFYQTYSSLTTAEKTGYADVLP